MNKETIDFRNEDEDGEEEDFSGEEDEEEAGGAAPEGGAEEDDEADAPGGPRFGHVHPALAHGGSILRGPAPNSRPMARSTIRVCIQLMRTLSQNIWKWETPPSSLET